MDKTTLLITNEHGGNDIPAEYAHLFKDHTTTLATHRGFDLGIYSLAESFAHTLKAPLYKNNVTRLLVDTNRSLWRRSLFSEMTKPLSTAEKNKILDTYYHPHRQRIAQFIKEEINTGRKILHIATHSFTPQLNGTPRQTDIGLLYNPERSNEKYISRLWKYALKEQLPDLRVRYNYPYRGKPDGLTAHFRKDYHNGHYVGIEMEVNQKYVQNSGHFSAKLRNDIVEAFQKAAERFHWL